ncbi:MAG: AMP-binding protein, partial [Planctomycetota bacterium]
VSALAKLFELGTDDRILSVLPLHHCFEFTCGMLLPLLSGSRLHFAEAPTPEAVREGLTRVRPTALIAVPALIEAFIRKIRREVKNKGTLAESGFDRALTWHEQLRDATGANLGRRVFKAAHDAFGGELRFMVSGGAALKPTAFRTLRGLGFDIYEGYGLSEFGPVISAGRPESRAKAGSVGRPIPGVMVKLEAKPGAENGERSTGELLAKGPSIMLGYDGDAEATAAAFTEDGWLRTGDLARIGRGDRITIVGRKKEVIVDDAGNTVYPDEIEAAYMGASGVAELAVARVTTGDGKEVPGALVRMSDDATEGAVRAALRSIDKTLPFPKRVKAVHVTHREIPRTATRKAKRAEVSRLIEAALAAERSRTPVTAKLGADTAKPEKSPLDRGAEARALVAEISDVAPDRILLAARLQDDLGLGSLALADLAAQIRERTGLAESEVLVQDLCTVADVAARLARRGSGAKAPRVAAPVVVKAEPKPLTVPPALKSMGNKVLSFLQRKAYEGPMRTKVTGREHIPWHTPTIVVANHCSHLDVGLIKHALGEYGRHAGSLAASDYFFKTPIRKMYFENFTEVLPMDRDAVSRDKLETVVTHVLEGQTVIMFPEGTRSTTGEVAPFLPGLGYLVSKAKIGVLPIFLEGTHDALPKGARVPRSRDIAAHIGPYLPYEELQRAAAGLSRHQAYRAISRAVRREVIALAPEGTVATPDPIEQLGDGLLTKVTVALTPVEP